MNCIRDEWRRIRSSSVAHNAGWMIAGQGLGYLLQGIYFFMLARLLGALEYGIFVGAFAFVNLTARYGTLGAGTVLLRYVSIDKSTFAVYWGNALALTTAGSCIMMAILYLAGRALLNPASGALVLLAALSNCFGTQVATFAAQIFQATEQMRVSALLNLLTNLLRATAAGTLLLLYHRISAWDWAAVSTIVSVIGSVVAVTVISVRLGRPQISFDLMRHRLVEGFGYAFANSTTSAYNDLDKTMLSHYDMNTANGIYTLAYRAVDVASVPIYSLIGAAMPRLFRKGAESLSETMTLAGRLWKRAAVVSLATAVALFVSAPLVPRFAGHTFSETVAALRWLCLIPFFRSMHEIAGGALMGAGLQRYRTTIQAVAVVLNLGLNLWLIPAFGWHGAAWSSLATDGVLGTLSWALLRILVMQSRRSASCPSLA